MSTYHVHSTVEHYFNLLFKLVRPNNGGLGRELFAKKLLIIGSSGKVGKQCEKIGKAFGMEIIPFDLALGDTKPFLNGLVAYADIIFLCVPLNKQTIQIINQATFRRMKQQPFIVNGARKGLINLSHAEQALKENTISGYALDDKTYHSIKKQKNFYSPLNHSGVRTIEAQQKSVEEIKKIIDTIKNNYESKELN